MTPEDKLNLLLRAEAAPPRDLSFVLATAERTARRRARLSVLAGTPWAAAAGVAVWAFGPWLGALAQGVDPVAAANVALGAVAVSASLWLVWRFERG